MEVSYTVDLPRQDNSRDFYRTAKHGFPPQVSLRLLKSLWLAAAVAAVFDLGADDLARIVRVD